MSEVTSDGLSSKKRLKEVSPDRQKTYQDSRYAADKRMPGRKAQAAKFARHVNDKSGRRFGTPSASRPTSPTPLLCRGKPPARERNTPRFRSARTRVRHWRPVAGAAFSIGTPEARRFRSAFTANSKSTTATAAKIALPTRSTVPLDPTTGSCGKPAHA